MRKKKVAIFTESFLPTIGGLQYELKWLLDAIDKELEEDERYKDLQVYFFAPNKEALNFCQFKNVKIENLELVQTSKSNIIKNYLRLKKIIGKIKPDLIHGQTVIPGGLLVYLYNKFSIQKVKNIITSHGVDIAINKKYHYGNRINKFNNLLTKIVLKNIDYHINISSPMADFARKAGTNRDKIIIIPNGLKPVDKNINQKLKEKIVTKYNIKKDNFCLLSLSGMRPIKGINYLIDEFAKAHDEDRRLKLFLACQGSETQKLKQKVKNIGLEKNIHFIGFVGGEIKKCFFDIADCYINTAIFEPFGITLLEAMDYGKILLVSKYGGAIDFIKDGQNGIFIDPLEVNNIKNNILRIMNNISLQRKMKNNNQKCIKKYYIDKIARQYLDLFISIVLRF